MKNNKNGFVTVSLVLWLNIILSMVTLLYSLVIKEVNMINANNRIENYKKYYAYYDVIKSFEEVINEKIKYNKDFNISEENYYLETNFRIYKIINSGTKEEFILTVDDREGNKLFRASYKYVIKPDNTMFFERRTNLDV